jgi:leucyl aminopeptidase
MKTYVISLALLPLAALAAPTRWVTVDTQILQKAAPQKTMKALDQANGVTLLRLTEAEIEDLSDSIHHDLHRCGGYVGHDSEAEAREALAPRGDTQFAVKALFADYAINQRSTVSGMVAQVQAPKIQQTIETLAAFNNRYYKADTGVQSSTKIRDMWQAIAAGRSDVKVELYQHSGWPQPSVILTIQGSSRADEIVVLGGHADSIAGGFIRNRARAPGADDNASGIATLTETLRVAIANNFKPARTVQFMAYAAEEVGLLGSKEIANAYKNQGKQVVGKVQLDMTLRKGTATQDIVMMSDFTNSAQNEFLGKLIDEYVKVPWGYSRCGYGCSDHASWTNAGFPASMPFESTMGDINRKIHTQDDTLANAGGNADHAAKFAKLAIAYMVELAN